MQNKASYAPRFKPYSPKDDKELNNLWKCKQCLNEWEGDFDDENEHIIFDECPFCDSTNLEREE